MATAHNPAMAAVTPRWSKRNAAQTMIGSVRNGSAFASRVAALLPNTPYPTIASASVTASASIFLPAGHAGASRAVQHRSNGVMTMMAEVSPCHQVHQFVARSDHAIAPRIAIAATPIVAATVEAAAARATNLNTSSLRAKLRGTPM